MMHRTDSVLLGSPDGRINLRLRKRNLIVGAVLMAACGALAVRALSSGSLALSTQEVLAAFTGDASQRIALIVLQWRLPRIVMALLFGAALGMSGALFQSLVRNPLGSPDVIGFSSGAHTGALLVIILQGNYYAITAGALTGGLAAAALVYLLAWRNGVQDLRLIIVGIAVSAMLGAFNTWLTISASLDSAMTAASWMAGSLNGLTWSKTLPAATCCLVAMLAALTQQRRMHLLEMGDDSASSLGVSTERTRLGLMGLGVLLTAAATAGSGPIAFIALAAPQLAKRLCRSHSTHLFCSASMGALLLLAADYASQHLFAPRQLPVGIVTASVGGLYLVWLLMRQTRTSS